MFIIVYTDQDVDKDVFVSCCQNFEGCDLTFSAHVYRSGVNTVTSLALYFSIFDAETVCMRTSHFRIAFAADQKYLWEVDCAGRVTYQRWR